MRQLSERYEDYKIQFDLQQQLQQELFKVFSKSKRKPHDYMNDLFAPVIFKYRLKGLNAEGVAEVYKATCALVYLHVHHADALEAMGETIEELKVTDASPEEIREQLATIIFSLSNCENEDAWHYFRKMRRQAYYDLVISKGSSYEYAMGEAIRSKYEL